MTPIRYIWLALALTACTTFPTWKTIETDIADTEQVVRICYRVMESSFPGQKIVVERNEEAGTVNLSNEPIYFTPDLGAGDFNRATFYCHIRRKEGGGHTIDAILVVEYFDAESDFSSYRWVPYATDEEFEETLLQQIRYRLRQGR